MKRYAKEAILLGIQLLFFYIYPLFMGPTDAMGMVLILLVMSFFLALVLGTLSANEIKYFYPAIVSILFIPSVFIYYNESALVHAAWYFITASAGLLIGAVLHKLLLRGK